MFQIFVHMGPNPLMSIFSLVKGEKEHEVFEMQMREGSPESLLISITI